MEEPQKGVKASILFDNTDPLLLGLFAAYFLIVTGITVFVLLHWGHVPWARFSELPSSPFVPLQTFGENAGCPYLTNFAT
ncbi:hypothetical protein BPNPMPFG_003646 [Mesorhizobium sp. AR07]|nr:hypothetical protein [Mesorhizobium sp. AR07]UVK47998.1 hypothetical protein BPNPMPFG_003646 [Mesorhizobium sp. AR07]